MPQVTKRISPLVKYTPRGKEKKMEGMEISKQSTLNLWPRNTSTPVLVLCHGNFPYIINMYIYRYTVLSCTCLHHSSVALRFSSLISVLRCSFNHVGCLGQPRRRRLQQGIDVLATISLLPSALIDWSISCLHRIGYFAQWPELVPSGFLGRLLHPTDFAKGKIQTNTKLTGLAAEWPK